MRVRSILTIGGLFAGSFMAFATAVWDSQVMETRTVIGQKTADVEFRFQVEDRPFEILSISSSCGCTTAKLDKMKYYPGEEGVIQVSLDLKNRWGPQKKFIRLQTNDPNNSPVQLEFRVDIPFVVRLEPRFVYWDMQTKDFSDQSIKMKFDTDADIRIVSAKSDQEQIEVAVEPSREWDGYELFLKPRDVEDFGDFFRAVIEIEVESDAPIPQKKFFAYAFMKNVHG